MKFSGLAALAPELACSDSPPPQPSKGDYTLRIGTARVSTGAGHSISTTTYNGQFPGPLLQLTVGRRAVIDVHNDTNTAERIHWHGQDLPGGFTPGAEEDATFVPARGMRRIECTPTHPGLYFYHSDLTAAADMDAGLYSGQAGPVLIAPRQEPGRFDREVVLVLKEFGASLRRVRHGSEVAYRMFTINGRMLGHGEPVRVNTGERVLFHVLNASATQMRSLALPGHLFAVVALDGNPVPSPAKVPVLCLGAGERVSASVEMNQPGVWILGDLATDDRERGMGIVVEYAGSTGRPEWRKPPVASWDYTRFGAGAPQTPAGTLEMVLGRSNVAQSDFSQWTINGVPFNLDQARPLFQVRGGHRYRLKIRNASVDVHPLHLRRHRFELVGIGAKVTAGVMKDVVTVGAGQQVEVDFVAAPSGRALFHCSRQLHRDFGLMALIDCV